jgi:hypothetical protein
MAAAKKAPGLTDKQLKEVLKLIAGADSVELKLTVPDENRRSTVEALGLDALDAYLRQVFFFDTPDLKLNKAGVVARARRSQGRPDDSVVKLRPVVPDDLPDELRAAKTFGVEVDAMPGGFVCSGSFKGELKKGRVKDAALAGTRPLRKLFSKQQRAFFAEHAPKGIELDDLKVLGPVNVLKLKSRPKGADGKLVTELWFYPDGSRILELSTKCEPDRAFEVAARAMAYLSERGVNLSGEQQTKTKTALEFFAGELGGKAKRPAKRKRPAQRKRPAKPKRAAKPRRSRA